jgi:hypothetical protein
MTHACTSQKYKLVAIDLDGTLLRSDNTVSSRTLAAARACGEAGVTLTIATGRMFRSTSPVAETLGLDAPLITYNGALIRTARTGETIFHHPMDLALAKEVLRFFRERHWYIQSYIRDVLYVDTENDKSRYYGNLAFTDPVPLGFELYVPQDAPTKLLAIADDEEQILLMRDSVKAHFGDRLFAAISNPLFLDMASPEVNKGKSLALLAKRLGVSREEILAIGDSENDLQLFEAAGFRVAMENARQSLKDAADAVTTSNDEDGVALALERYVLENC